MKPGDLWHRFDQEYTKCELQVFVFQGELERLYFYGPYSGKIKWRHRSMNWVFGSDRWHPAEECPNA